MKNNITDLSAYRSTRKESIARRTPARRTVDETVQRIERYNRLTSNNNTPNGAA